MKSDNRATSAMTAAVFNGLYRQLKEIHVKIAGLTQTMLPGECEAMQQINIQNEALVGQIAIYNELHPELNAPHINWNTFEAAWQARTSYEALEKLTASLSKACADAKTITDYSLVQMSMTAFDYVKVKSQEEGAASPYYKMIQKVEQVLPLRN